MLHLKIFELLPGAHYNIQCGLTGTQHKETFLRHIKRILHFENQKSSFIPDLIILLNITAQYYISRISLLFEFLLRYSEMSPKLFVWIHFRLVFVDVELVYFALRFVYCFLDVAFPIIVVILICALKLENSLLTSHSEED